MAKILVTGAAGTLGRALIPLLLDRGDAVRAVDIRELPFPPRAALQRIEMDLRDRDALPPVVESVDSIVHAAAWHGMHLRDHPARDFWELNVDATFALFE